MKIIKHSKTMLAVTSTALMFSLPALANTAGEGYSSQQTPKQSQSRQGSGNKDMQKKDRTVMGKVIDSMDVKLKGVAGNGHRLIKIESTTGKKMIVNVGKVGSLDEISLTRGDFLIATGRSARIGGKPVLFAKYVGELQAAGRTGMLKMEDIKQKK